MIAFLVALAVAATGTPLVIWALHRLEMIDVPNHRSSHAEPIPRGGGIAVAAGTVSGTIVAGAWSGAIAALMVGGVALGATGLLDDRRGLPATPRLIVQVMTPVIATLAVADRAGLALGAAVVVAAIAVAGYVNAFNFMDGINGISGLQAIVGGGFLAVLGRHAELPGLEIAGWAVAGSSLGFLPFNAPRARTFLGDVGSYFLGFWLAGLALLLVDAGLPVLVTVAPFSLYLIDTASVLVRRARRGAPLMEAHREHAYQRLTQQGWSHLQVAGLCAVISAVAAAIMYAVVDDGTPTQFAAFAACLVLVGGYLALPSVLERRFDGTHALPS